MTTQPQQAAHHEIELPDSWRWLQLRRVASCISRSLPETTDPLFEFRYLDIGSVGPGRLLEPPVRIVFKDAPSRARRTVSEGDVIVSTVRPYLRAVLPIDAELSDVVVSTGFAVFRPRDEVSSAWLGYAMQSTVFIDSVVRESKGVAYPAVTDGVIARTLLPVPPEGDQRQIARYLDSATAEIEKAVVAEHRLMSLLEEEKQAMISAALGISAGLSPQGFAPFRDANGLSQPVRLKNLLTEVAKRSTTGQGQLFSLRKGIGLVATGSVYGKEVAPEQLVGYKRVEAGQLVMNRMRASTGLFGVAPSDGLVSPDYAVYRVSPQVDPEFLVAVLRLPQFGAVIRANSKGLGTGASGFMRVYSEQLGQLTVPVPPLAEQRRIVAEITENGRRIDQAIDSHERQIALLDEYRARLVADVVTGKLDVRELADDLPELEVTESSLLASREGSQLEDVV